MKLVSAFTLLFERHTDAGLIPARRHARRLMRALWAAGVFAVGLLLLRRLSTLGDWKEAWDRSRALGPALLLLLAMPAVGHFVKMLGWRNLLPRAARPSLAHAYGAFVAAQAVNELGFSVLGEPLKILVLPGRARAAGLRAVLADNLTALAALVAVVISLAIGRTVVAPYVLGAVVLLARLGREPYRRLLSAFAAHYAGKSWLVAELALGLHLLGEASLAPAVPLSLAWLGAAAVGAPVPAQLGVVEAALVHSGTALGLSASTLLSLALIRRVRGVVWLVLGLLLAARLAPHLPKGNSDVPTTAS